jgi:hypothetical protein
MAAIPPKMDPTIKASWVSALKNKTYTPIYVKGVMFDGKGYCPLGVLINLYIKAKSTVGWVLDPVHNTWSFEGYTKTLPPSVQEWASCQTNPILRVQDSAFGPVCDMQLTLLSDQVLTRASVNSNWFDQTPYSWDDLAALIQAQL